MVRYANRSRTAIRVPKGSTPRPWVHGARTHHFPRFASRTLRLYLRGNPQVTIFCVRSPTVDEDRRVGGPSQTGPNPRPTTHQRAVCSSHPTRFIPPRITQGHLAPRLFIMTTSTKHTLRLRLLSLLVLPAVGAAAAQPAEKPESVISACDKPFMFGFGAWEKASTAFGVKADGIHLVPRTARAARGSPG